MSDIERDIFNFIRNKDIDFLQTEYTISISVDSYSFELSAELMYDYPDEHGNCELVINCTLLKNYYEFVVLSNDFKQQIADWFGININYNEENLEYLMGLNNCLRGSNIRFTA